MAELRSSLLPPLCRRTPPRGGGHGMAELVCGHGGARGGGVPPPPSSLLPLPHRARPTISLLVVASASIPFAAPAARL